MIPIYKLQNIKSVLMSSDRPALTGPETSKTVHQEKNISEQQIRGVKIRMECRGTEDIQKESLYLEISDTGKVQASHDGNSDQTVMVLVPVGMAFYMHLTYSDYHMFTIHCFTMLCYHMYAQNESQFED